MPGAILSPLYILTHLSLTKTLGSKLLLPHQQVKLLAHVMQYVSDGAKTMHPGCLAS